jgi:hypothetical protein
MKSHLKLNRTEILILRNHSYETGKERKKGILTKYYKADILYPSNQIVHCVAAVTQ